MTELDRALDALGRRYRRRLLVSLTVHNPQDAGENGLDADDLLEFVDDQQGATDIEISHSHLPKLEHYGYITWDRSSGNISKGPNWDEIEPLIDLLKTHNDELPVEWL